MNPKLPTYTYFKTFLSSPSPENKHAQVSHQQNASTSTPQAKVSRSIGTQSHRHNGLTKPHNNEHAEIPPRSGFVLQQSKLPKTITKPRPHRKICTLRSSIKNVSTPALARHERKHHGAFDCNTPPQRLDKTHNYVNALGGTIRRGPCT